MKEETKANAAEAGSETPTTKDANFDVLLAERAKREQNIKLYKEYRHPKDVTSGFQKGSRLLRSESWTEADLRLLVSLLVLLSNLQP